MRQPPLSGGRTRGHEGMSPVQRRADRIAKLVTLLLLSFVVLAPSGAVPRASARLQSSSEMLPSVELDDAARLVRAADFPETEELVSGFGAVLGPADYAGSLGGEPAAGGPFEDLDLDQRVDLLDELGWLSVAQLNIGVATPDGTDFTAQLYTSITRFESSRAAEEAFDVLEDESDDRAAEDEEAPDAFGSPSEITVADDANGVYRNLTFVVDDAHVNVVVIGPEDNPVLTDELLIDAGELLADRLELDIDELPGLGTLVVRIDSDGESVFAYQEEYLSLNGDTPRDAYDDEEGEYENRVDQWRDLDHVYAFLGGFLPDGSVVTRLYDAEDEAAAEALMETLEENPAPAFYDTWELGDDDPELGDESHTATYTYALGEDEYQGYAVIFRVGELVARVEVDAPEDVGDDVTLDLAEAQLACIEDGDCEPFELPADLMGGADEGGSGEDPLGPTGGDDEGEEDQ